MDSYVGEASDWYFCIFLLSRGVYNLKKYGISDYSGLIMDFTDPSFLPNWMDFDRLYLFKMRQLKKEIDNIMIPFQRTIDIINAKNIIFADTTKFTIMIEYEDYVDLLIFENIIEAWKFYGYATNLFYNARETQNSLIYDIEQDPQI